MHGGDTYHPLVLEVNSRGSSPVGAVQHRGHRHDVAHAERVKAGGHAEQARAIVVWCNETNDRRGQCSFRFMGSSYRSKSGNACIGGHRLHARKAARLNTKQRALVA